MGVTVKGGGSGGGDSGSTLTPRVDSAESNITELQRYVDNDGIKYTSIKDVPNGTETAKGVVQVDGTTLSSVNGVVSANLSAATKRVVPSESQMLSLPTIQNLYVVTRTDVDRVYYLNAGQNPSVLESWERGPSTTDVVSSFNGRSGDIVAEPSDYGMADISGLSLALSSKQDVIDNSNRLDTSNVGTGVVSNAEFNHLDGARENIQGRLDTIPSESAITALVDSKVDPVKARVTNLENDKILPLIDQFYKHAVPEMSPVYSNNRIQWGGGRILFLWMTNSDVPSGHFNIRMPVEGTVIPYLTTPSRTGETVTSEGILLTRYYTLWYVLPFGQIAEGRSENFFYTLYSDAEVTIPADAVRVATGLGTGDVYITSVGVVPRTP